MARLTDDSRLYEIAPDGEPVLRVKLASSTITAVVNITGDEADLDTGAGLDPHEVFAIGLPAAGGHVIGGTVTNPIRTDPTNDTETLVQQPVHDQLNLNSNLQVGDIDVSLLNKVPVQNPIHDDLAVNANLQIGDDDVDAENPVSVALGTQAALAQNILMYNLLTVVNGMFQEQRKMNIYLEHITDLGILNDDFLER